MSGFKRASISIGQDEYDRLREAEICLRSLPEPSPQASQQIILQSVERLQAHQAAIRERQARYEQALTGMDDSVRDLENRTSQALMDYQTRIFNDVQSYAGSLWRDSSVMIAEQAEQFQTQIAEVHQQHQHELAQLTRRMRKIAGNAHRKEQIAAGWLASAVQLADFINENYNDSAFFPQRFTRLAGQLEQAQQNLGNGLAEASIALSQQLYFGLSDLRLDLEQAQQEWNLLYQAAIEAVDQLSALTFASQFVQAIDLDGNPLPERVDVPYWAADRWESLSRLLSERREYLIDHGEAMSIAELKKWLSSDLPGIQKFMEEMIINARVSALNSQLRINIADLVIRALQGQGFALAKADYQTDDQRNAFEATLFNLSQNEVVVTVQPSGEAPGDNTLFLQSYDQDERTERELQLRWGEISRSLRLYGLEVGDYQVVDLVQPSVQDKKRLKQRSARTVNTTPQKQRYLSNRYGK